MRERPSVHLTKNHVGDEVVPHDYLLVANDGPIEGLLIGNVYLDVDTPSLKAPWAARVWTPKRGDLGHFRTRQEAILAVAQGWALSQDEIEAYNVELTMQTALVWADENAREQRHKNGDDTPLVVTRGGMDEQLYGTPDYLADVLLRAKRSVRDRLAGIEVLDLPTLAEDVTVGRMVELELQRRERQQPTCPRFEPGPITKPWHRRFVAHPIDEPCSAQRTSLTREEWHMRARQLAEEYGRALANSMDLTQMLPFHHYDAYDLRANTIYAADGFYRAKDLTQAPWDCEALCTRAKLYQEWLNQSHLRALNAHAEEMDRIAAKRLVVPAKRCEEHAIRGTGTGICNAPINAHGTCINAGNHLDS